MSLNGHPDGEPHKTPLPFIDLTSGMFATQGILGALYARQNTGRGQLVNVVLYDDAVNLASFQLMNYLVSGVSPVRLGNHSPVVAPVDLFDAEDGTFFMNVAGDRVWDKLVGVLGRDPALLSEEFATNQARVRNEAKLKPILQRLFANKSMNYWMNALRTAGVPAGPVNSIADAARSPEMADRAIINEAPHSGAGMIPNIRLPFSLSDTPLVPARGAPLLGEHTHHVLSDLLRYSPDRIAELARSGAIPAAKAA